MNSQSLIRPAVLLIAISFFFIVCPFPTASALPTVAWNFGTYSLSDGSIGSTPNQITVDDPVAAGSGSIQVNLTSSSDPIGIPLTLTETATLGEFQNTNIIFSNTLKTIPVGSTVTVSLEDSLANLDPNAVETLDAIVLSTSDSA